MTMTIDDLATEAELNVQDVIDRWEELSNVTESAREQEPGVYRLLDGTDVSSALDELQRLEVFLNSIKGKGSDNGVSWRDNDYPAVLINEDHWEDYSQQVINDNLPDLPDYVEIDWETTSQNFRDNYTDVEFEGGLFWYEIEPT